MKRYVLFAGFLCLMFSCKFKPDSGRNSNDPAKVYKLKLNPSPGSAYHYDIINESRIQVEVDDKDVDNLNRTTTGVTYHISKDSTGNFALNIKYDKVHIYTKSGDTETDADAANALVSSEPLERILGILTRSDISVTINPSGEVRGMSGYKELGEKIMADMNITDAYSRDIIKTKWDKMIGAAIIRKNMDQFFKIFPDSVVRVNDSWKQNSKEEGEINMNVKNIFTLKEINNDIALINSEATMNSDTISTFMGYNDIIANLKGNQEGQFEVNMKTGMLVSCNVKSKVTGTIEMMGREIPVKISSKIKIERIKK
ncbi:MAG: DUF6263 family protein [Ginsengibacter sp.]